MSEDIEAKRAIWHSRRGMLELDVLLVPFAEKAYPLLDEADKKRYQDLLECEDPDLFTWFLKSQIPDPEHIDIVNKILAFKKQKHFSFSKKVSDNIHSIH